jgi:hypothetical protein
MSLTDSSAPHIENNFISARPEEVSQHFSDNKLSINTIDNEKAEIEEVLPSKFEYQYALCEEG